MGYGSHASAPRRSAEGSSIGWGPCLLLSETLGMFMPRLLFPGGFTLRTASRAGIGMQAHSCVQGDSFKGQLWLESSSSARPLTFLEFVAVEIQATSNFFLSNGLDIQLSENFLLCLPISTLTSISPNRSLVNLFSHVHLEGPEITHLDFVLTDSYLWINLILLGGL